VLPKPHSLQTRFLVGLLIMMGCLGGLSALSLNNHLQRLMENEARDRAALILAQAEAVQSYVRSTLRPAMYAALPENTFIIEAMSSSFVTRAVMSEPAMTQDRFVYRRVAEGARNPVYEAQDYEIELIRRFRQDPTLSKVEEILPIGEVPRFITAKPVRFEAACMHCHGDPAEAPQALLKLYGSERGFWRSEGELAGMTMVALPLDQAASGVREAVVSFAVLFGISMLGLFLIIQVFFNRLVVHSLRRMGTMLHKHFSDEADTALFDRLHSLDEIEDLMAAMESLAGHLRQARVQLRDYASNLESMVASRTVDLSSEASARRADVELFVALLDGLNQHTAKSELLTASLDLVARRFGADRAAYACVLDGSKLHVWPKGCATPVLPADWHDIVTGAPRLESTTWYVPVQTNEATRGLLCLYWDKARQWSSRSVELAQAVGRQLGIAMDNIEALDNLLHQNALLDAIFEGISDPLLLLDSDGRPLLVNSSARELLRAGEKSISTEELGRLAHTAGDTLCLEDGRTFSIHRYDLIRRMGHGHVVYLREITDELRMLERAQQQEKLAAVGKLAAGLAHEINNPLGVILCHAELLHSSAPTERARADLEIIIRHTEQAQKVLRDLLDFARHKPAESQDVDIHAILQGLSEVFRPRLRSQRVELRLDLAKRSLPALVKADRNTLEQIFTNILINALDALEGYQGGFGGGRIHIATQIEGEELCVAIADSGPGIPETDLVRVFDPFFTTKDVGRGTGLGLSVVFGLVHDLGGRIDVSNAAGPEDGACFTLTFPLAAPSNGD